MPEIKSFDELFTFYNDYVKILYCEVQLNDILPTEVMFEINAAFDHLSRHWTYKEDEKKIVEKAFSHLKRSCLDIFKIKLKETLLRFEQLQIIDLSLIDNGSFQKEMISLITEIKKEAIEARRLEGDKRYDDTSVKAFDRWSPIFQKCKEFEEKYFTSPKIEWAKQKESEHIKELKLQIENATKIIDSKYSAKSFWISVAASFISGIVLYYLFELLKHLSTNPASAPKALLLSLASLFNI